MGARSIRTAMGHAPENDEILGRALAHAHRWLESVPGRRVPATGTADDVAARLGTDLPEQGRPARPPRGREGGRGGGGPATGTADDVAARLGTDLPEQGRPAADVLDGLVEAVEPGLMANASGRFFGWVMGASLPTALAADWLV